MLIRDCEGVVAGEVLCCSNPAEYVILRACHPELSEGSNRSKKWILRKRGSE